MTHLPLHPHLVHPLTGEPLRAIYRTKGGQLIWPQLGGDGTVTPPASPAPTAPPAPPTGTPVPPAPTGTPPAPLTYVPPPSLVPPAPPAPTGPQYVPPVPVPGPAPQADPEARDWSKLPQWAQQEAAKLKDENAKRRISERTAVINQHAHYAAGQLGANAAALLGSTAFAEASKGLDPHAPDFAAQLTAVINATVAANPWMAAAPTTPAAPGQPPAPPTSGAEFPGGNNAGMPITEAQLNAMSAAEIAKALEEGRLKHLL